MRRRVFLAALGGTAAIRPWSAWAQKGAKKHRIGILAVPPFSTFKFRNTFPAALRELGYADDDLLLEWHSAEGRSDRIAALAVGLSRADVDVIVTLTNTETLAAKTATSTIPIVMVAAVDPVAAGLVAGFARPGGNVTGSTWFAPETAGKILALLKEAVPGSSRIVYLIGANFPGVSAYVEGMHSAARSFGVMLHVVEVQPTDGIGSIFEGITRWRADALIVATTAGHRDAILTFAAQSRVPAIFTLGSWVEAGGLMGYTPSALEAAERTARFVDRILKGARPADLPVEQPTRFELLVNLKTARAMGLELPSTLLARADEVIE